MISADEGANAIHRGSDIALEELVSAWQAWSPDAPDELTVNLTLTSEPGAPVQATLFGAATLEEGSTGELLQEFIDRAGVAPRSSCAPA